MSGQGGVERQSRKAGAAPTWGAAIVNHGSYDDLDACLASLAGQTHVPDRIVVWDTGVDVDRLEALQQAHPKIHFVSGPNLGYAGGANRAIGFLGSGPGAAQESTRAGSAASGSAAPLDFILVLNPDVLLDADFAAQLIASTANEPAVAIATGKLLRPGRRVIDSAGIVFPRHRRPRDRGSESIDRGQFDRREWVDAASGAAMLLRASALENLSVAGELFDERFFAYHEDTDLCWRARRLGFRVLYEPRAVAVHARGWQRSGRKKIPVEIRRHSFKNHYLQLMKNETRAGFLINLPWILGWELLRLGFVLTRDRAMLPAYRDAARELPGAWRKRAALIPAGNRRAR
jgi:GT2 family glycosyltransferase